MTQTEARQVFARLMAKAREGRLSTLDRERLTQARQMLRRARRPAMNPRTNMDYEAIDRDMSSYVVTSKKQTTRFFLTDEGLATDIPSRAKRFRWLDLAEKAADEANHDPGWRGFKWKPMSVAEMMATRKNPRKLTRRKARLILDEGQARGRKLTPRQRRFFGARASGYPEPNPQRKPQRLGRALEVRYQRTIGEKPGYYRHPIQSRKAGVYTVSEGWVYVGSKSILITEEEPHV
jgi:hypothetical protein